MGFWDTAKRVGMGLATGGLSEADNIWEWGKGRSTAPSMGPNPYQNDWGTLIGQLQRQASGNGPSLAGEAYKQANQQGMQNVLAMSRGGSAGATRQGQLQLGQMNQGLNQGYSNARLQEQLAARQMLQGALQGAGQAWYQPQYANLFAQMNSPTNLQMLTSFLQQLGAAGARTQTGGGAA